MVRPSNRPRASSLACNPWLPARVTVARRTSGLAPVACNPGPAARGPGGRRARGFGPGPPAIPPPPTVVAPALVRLGGEALGRVPPAPGPPLSAGRPDDRLGLPSTQIPAPADPVT